MIEYIAAVLYAAVLFILSLKGPPLSRLTQRREFPNGRFMAH
jgi:hypothetical protein